MCFYWRNDFIKKAFEKLFKERFYWTNDFTKRSFSETTNEIYRKWTTVIEKNEWFVHERWTNEMKKRTRPSLSEIIFGTCID